MIVEEKPHQNKPLAKLAPIEEQGSQDEEQSDKEEEEEEKQVISVKRKYDNQKLSNASA